MDLHVSMRILSSSSTDVRKRSSPKLRRKVVIPRGNLPDAYSPTSGSLPRNINLSDAKGFAKALETKSKSSSLSGTKSKSGDEWQTLVTAFTLLFSSDSNDETCPTWRLMDKVRELRYSYAGEFLYEFFEHKILPNEMGLIRASLEKAARHGGLMEKLEKSWNLFYFYTLPKLQLVLSPIKNDLSARETSLRAYRDHVVLELQECGYLESQLNYEVGPAIKQMLLVLQTIHDSNLSSSYGKLVKLVSLVVPFVSLVPIKEKRDRSNGSRKEKGGGDRPRALSKVLHTSKSDANLTDLANEEKVTTVVVESTPAEPLKSALVTSSNTIKKLKKTHFRSRSDFTLYHRPEATEIVDIDYTEINNKPPQKDISDHPLPQPTLPLGVAASKLTHSRSKSDLTSLFRFVKKRTRSSDRTS